MRESPGFVSMFNMTNPTAMLDNFRESSFETTFIAHIVPTLAVPAFATEPLFRGAVWSGAGGSWIENILYKQSPLETRPLAEALLGYPAYGRELTASDAALSLVQWVGEGTDPPTYGHALADERDAGEGRSILMFQGIVDTYILPPIANSLSLSVELDRRGLPWTKEAPLRRWVRCCPIRGARPSSCPPRGIGAGRRRWWCNTPRTASRMATRSCFSSKRQNTNMVVSWRACGPGRLAFHRPAAPMIPVTEPLLGWSGI